MSEAKKVYFCEICGNQVEMLLEGGGELICCGEAMKLLDKTDERAKTPAHVLIIEEISGKYRVTVGNPPHPMTEEHHIDWIEAWGEGRVCRRELKPGDEPVAEFPIAEIGEDAHFRAYCNLHGMRYCPRCEK